MENELNKRDHVGVQDFVLLEDFQDPEAFRENLRKRFNESLIYVSIAFVGFHWGQLSWTFLRACAHMNYSLRMKYTWQGRETCHLKMLLFFSYMYICQSNMWWKKKITFLKKGFISHSKSAEEKISIWYLLL